MEVRCVIERVEHLAHVRSGGTADASRLEAALVSARQIEGWVQAQVAALVARLSTVESFPEATIASTSKCSIGQANKAKERADTLASTPKLAHALSDGAITAGHVDAVTRGSKKLEPAQQEAFITRVDELVDVAAAATIDQFSKRLDLEIRKIRASDGEDRLTRQKRSTRLSTWTDGDGMWNIRGRFDPVAGIALSARVDNTIQALFARETPEHCPTDPIEKSRFLAAHALMRLIQGGTGSTNTGRVEFVAVIEADAPDQPGPVVSWPIPVELPARVVAELANDADVVGVVVRNGVVLHAPGELNLGRATRLANRAQRRALRCLYRHCAIPSCTVAFDRCKLHHIIWWRHGGRTDLGNLLPVCSRHHGNIHHDGWIVELGANRALTLRLPDGALHNTGPPNRRAA